MYSFLNNVKTKEDFNNPNNYCLLLTVDDSNSANNKLITNGKENFQARNYITESIRCISAWRKKGGFLKDISIIVDYIGMSDLTDEVINLYMKYNVNVITNNHHKYKRKMVLHNYGFINVHLTGMELNNQRQYNHIMRPITIHIDLDMELLQPMPPEFFYPLLDHACIVGGYRKEDLPNQRSPLFGREPLNTDLIVTKYIYWDNPDSLTKEEDTNYYNTGRRIYNSIVHHCTDIAINYEDYKAKFFKDNPDINYNEVNFREFDIEEYGADAAYALRMDSIEENKKFLLGDPDQLEQLDQSDIGLQPWYIVREDSYEQGEGYFEVKNIDLSRVFFWHEHILDKPNEYFTKQKIKLMNAINNYRKEHNNEKLEKPENPENSQPTQTTDQRPN